MNEHYIDVNGWRTRYVEAGKRGPALILLHGLGASLESWYPNVDPLGENFRVFAPDIVYFGKSAKPERDPQHADFVEFTARFMDKLGIERAVLIGNSMGGAIAVRTAIEHPGRVAGLVLVNSAGFGRELAWWLRMRTLIDLRPAGTPPPWLARLGLRAIFHEPSRVSDELLEILIRVEQDVESLRTARRVLNIGVDWRGLKPEMLEQVRDAADKITVPTTIVWGKQDRVVPVRHAFEARRRIPQARLHLFESCGHTPQLEHPAPFNALVRDFANEVFA